MRTATPVLSEDAARHETLAAHTHAFEPLPIEQAERYPTTPSGMPMKNALLGHISVPATFRGTIYVGLFTSPIPQGKPVRCTKLSLPGVYLLHGMPDGVYYLRAAA